MKKRLLVLSVCLLLISLCFFLLCTEIGHDLVLRLFPSANLGEKLILWHARHEEDFPAASPAVSMDFYGSYVLTEVSSPEFSLSTEELDAIRGLGIPLQLEILPYGSAVMNVFDLKTEAVMNVFDLKTELFCDSDNMLLRTAREDLFYFYQDGRLTVVDGEDHLCFEKAAQEDKDS